MEAYAGFAGIYDLLMDDFDYPAWADYYLKMLSDAGVSPRAICDCACGTGSMSVEFAKRGVDVTGADISSEMLRYAADKARAAGRQIRFICQDMCALRLTRPVDALVCACDGVNYLLTDKRVEAFFRAAHDAIRPGGAIAFDVSSPHKLRDVLGDGFFAEERDEAAYIWQNSLRGDVVNMDITFFIRDRGDLYRRVTENHRQRIQMPDRICKLLSAAGFTNIRVFGDRTFDAPRADEMRIHFCANRE